jgi:hypothetical protein
MKLPAKIIKIYKKRNKAYEILLKCDIEIDELLKKLNRINKESKNNQ